MRNRCTTYANSTYRRSFVRLQHSTKYDGVVQFVLELHVREQAEGLVEQQLAQLAGEQRRLALPRQSRASGSNLCLAPCTVDFY